MVYSEPVEMVTLQGSEGQMGILSHPTPLIAQLVPGEMIVQKNGHKDFLAVGEGIVLVSSDLVAVVTDMVVAAKNDTARVIESRRRADAGCARRSPTRR